MGAPIESETRSPSAFQQWLTAGDSLYNGLLKEFQVLQEKLSDLEAQIQQKSSEVNQIAQVLGKPAVQNTRLAAELVSNIHAGEMRTNDEALRIRPPTLRPTPVAATRARV